MTLRVLVKLKRKESLTWDGQQLVISLHTTPVKGAANRRLEKVTANWLDVPVTSVIVQKGQNSRHKTLRIDIEESEFLAIVKKLPKFPEELRL